MRKPELKNSNEIIDYIQEVSVDSDVDIEMLEEMFRGLKANLILVDITSLDMSNEENHLKDQKKQKIYNNLDPQDSPPIIVDSNLFVIDGRHRVRAHIYQGVNKIRAYVLSDAK